MRLTNALGIEKKKETEMNDESSEKNVEKKSEEKTGKPFILHVRNYETGEIEEIEIDDVIIEMSDKPVNFKKSNDDSDEKSEESSGK